MFQPVKDFYNRVVVAAEEAGSVLQYLKDRLTEGSTWASIGVSVSAAAVLPWPWPLASLVCGLSVALIPNKPKAP